MRPFGRDQLIELLRDPSLTPGHALELVLAVLGNDSERSPATVNQLATEMARFVSTMDLLGAVDVREVSAKRYLRYLDGAARKPNGSVTSPSASTRSNRRSAVRFFFATLRKLGYQVTDPSLDLGQVSKPIGLIRALSDGEHRRVRAAANSQFFTARNASIIALAEAGASNAEIASARVGDVDFDAGTIRLAGSTRTFPRVNRLDEWQINALSRRITYLRTQGGSCDRLAFNSGTLSTSHAASISNAIRDVLNQSCTARAFLKPDSVRAWAARKLYAQSRSLLEVGGFLGTRDLNTAARFASVEWPPTDRVDQR